MDQPYDGTLEAAARMSEEVIAPIPNLNLASKKWTLQQPKLAHLHASARQDLLQGIENDGQSPFIRVPHSYSMIHRHGALP